MQYHGSKLPILVEYNHIRENKVSSIQRNRPSRAILQPSNSQLIDSLIISKFTKQLIFDIIDRHIDKEYYHHMIALVNEKVKLNDRLQRNELQLMQEELLNKSNTIRNKKEYHKSDSTIFRHDSIPSSLNFDSININRFIERQSSQILGLSTEVYSYLVNSKDIQAKQLPISTDLSDIVMLSFKSFDVDGICILLDPSINTLGNTITVKVSHSGQDEYYDICSNGLILHKCKITTSTNCLLQSLSEEGEVAVQCMHSIPGWDGKLPIFVASRSCNITLLDKSFNQEIILSSIMAFPCNNLESALRLIKIATDEYMYSYLSTLKLPGGISLINFASLQGNFQLVSNLIQYIPDINLMTNSFTSDTILHDAVRANSISIVKLSLENGIDLLRINNEGNTALHLACQLGYPDITRELLSHENFKRALKIRNVNGKNPFQLCRNSFIKSMITEATS